jgi:NADH-quinone oxidoreductase subunit M
LTTFSFPWVEAAIVPPLVAALWVRWLHDPVQTRRFSLIACGLTLVCAAGAWAEFALSPDAASAHNRWSLLGDTVFTIDGLSAPLLPLVSLLYLLTALATLGTKVRRFSFSSMLVSEAILLATLSCKQPWIIIALLAAGTIPPFVELYGHRRPWRVYALHMALFVALLVGGQALISWNVDAPGASIVGVTLLMAAVLVRSGILPVHCWMTDLFEHATFGTALLFVTPMVGTYAAMRLVFPIAPDWVLHGIASLSLATALYAAGMALVQREARRLFCYLFLSHSSLVFVGLEMATSVGVTAALCAWLSIALSMAGFGLTLRAIEARTGRLSIDEFHGLFPHTPLLAALFLITGLASIGFPGTVGFIGTELLVEGTVRVYPLMGIAVVVTAALNGLAVLQLYFRVFTGTRHVASIDLNSRPPERIAVLVLSALILGGGLYPQPGVVSRYDVATQLVEQRAQRLATAPAPGDSKLAVLRDPALQRRDGGLRSPRNGGAWRQRGP